jgi:error-prone DNA polymerase
MFQVESRAQMNFLPKAKPETFYDLVVQVAIIRPGPIVGNMLNVYLRRRQGLEEVDYMHPSLKPVLERTLGVPLFQEQVLKIGMEAAGLTGGEAEELRRALGFKRADKKLKVIEEKMRRGMTAKGLDKETQDKIVASVYAFANYGFPESHAASFALLTYASAYLKVHHLDAFTAAMLNNYPLGFYSPATLVKDAQRHGLGFRPIDVNASDHVCTLEADELRIGLNYVKGLRKETAEAIAAERRNGPYANADDLIARVPVVNRKELRSLALTGALDAVDRRRALWQVELAIREKGELFADQTFDRTSKTPFLKRMSPLEHVAADLSRTGLTLGPHPMTFVRDEMNRKRVLSSAETLTMRRKDPVTVAGAVIVRQRPETARGVMFITLEDETGFTNVIVLPETLERYRAVINENRFLLIKGVAENETMVKALYFEPLNVAAQAIVSHDYQ